MDRLIRIERVVRAPVIVVDRRTESPETSVSCLRHVVTASVRDGRLHARLVIGLRRIEYSATWSSGVGEVRWRGPWSEGRVIVTPVSVMRTRVLVRMVWRPRGVGGRVVGLLGLDTRWVRGELQRFALLVESEAWEELLLRAESID